MAELPLKVAVAGLWHLGCVTAACCARYFPTVGIDFNEQNVARLRRGQAPLREPGLDELLAAGIASGQLRFATEAVAADVLWLTYDTPVNDLDEPDVEFVLERARRLIGRAPLVLVSSQLPVGTCARLELEFPHIAFACSPENLRLGKALESFQNPGRIVAGVRGGGREGEASKALLGRLFAPFCENVIWMKTESAEMVKHGLNSFLALSIAYINEVAAVCEGTGADAGEVAAGLKSDPRIGPRAYLSPGAAFAGGTLARDVVSLSRWGEENGGRLALIPAILESNRRHAGWAWRVLCRELKSLPGRKVAVLGLTYTAGTDTLRRSHAVELCEQLAAGGAEVVAYDPAVASVPPQWHGVFSLSGNAAEAVDTADAVVIETGWPELRGMGWKTQLVVDANGYLQREMAARGGGYFRVGAAQ